MKDDADSRAGQRSRLLAALRTGGRGRLVAAKGWPGVVRFGLLAGLLGLLGLWLLGGLGAATAETERTRPGGAPPPGSGSVDLSGFVRVIDGNTVETYIDGKQTGIRIIGLDVPMGNTACGKDAADQLRGLVRDGLHLDEDDQLGFDDRTLRLYYARTRDGRSVAQELVRSGVARSNGVGHERASLNSLAGAESARSGCLRRAELFDDKAAGLASQLGFDLGPKAALSAPGGPLQASTAAAPLATANLPSGFNQETVVSSLTNPTAFAFLPGAGNRIVIAEKKGLVRLVKNGVLQTTPLIDIRDHVNDYWDRGLIGLTPDKDFASNGYLYLFYVYENNPAQYNGTKTVRLTRVTVSGDTAGNETVILGNSSAASCNDPGAIDDCLPSDYFGHSAGNVKAASDGTLFLSAGDGSSWNVVDDNALRAQNPDSLAGKIIHITSSGAAASNNPFVNQSGASSNKKKVWAYGLRNPYRFNLNPNNGLPYLGDVGWSDWEEVDVATAGANMGWPCYEGPAQQSGYAAKDVCQTLYNQGSSAVKAPLYTWAHPNSSAAATGGTFYTGTVYPSAYQGAYFYADYGQSFIKYLTVDASNNKSGGPTDFLNAADNPVAIEMGPDDYLYYLSITGGALRRITYAVPPPPPPTGTAYIGDLTWSSMTNGYGPAEKNRSNGNSGAADGQTITLNGVTYAKGLGTHSNADVRYYLGGSCSSFSSLIGVDDEVDSDGAVIFQVWADGVQLSDSGVMTGDTPTQSVSVGLAGRNELALIVLNGHADQTDHSFNHADWANAQLVCSGGSDSTAPTVNSVAPVDGAIGVGASNGASADFSEALNPSTISSSTFTLTKQGASSPLSATVSYDPQTLIATLLPGASLQAGSTYTARIKGGSSGVKDLAGNALAADRVWSFTTASGNAATTYLSDLNWTRADNGWGPVEKDHSNGDDAAGDGHTLTINGTTYSKGLGAHARSEIHYNIGGVCSAFDASVGIDDEVEADGIVGSVTFQVWADGTKLYEGAVLSSDSAVQIVHVDLSGRDELVLIVTNGGDGNADDHADWAAARVTCSGGGDTTAPIVTSTSPAAGATGVSADATISATFSESIDSATITGSTALLVKQGSATPVAVTHTYVDASHTLTIAPTGSLEAGASYTVTLKSGSDGIKDLSGRPLDADKVWSFTVAALANGLPQVTISPSPVSQTFQVGDPVAFSGSATDPDEGALAASALAWQVILHHCPGGVCHTHPFLNPTGVSNLSFDFPDHGDDSYLEIVLTATDSRGGVGSASVTIQPKTVQLVLASAPSGLQVVYGGATATTPATYTTIVGGVRTIYAPDQTGVDFDHWSDGGDQSHNITIGASPTTYTATFNVTDTVKPTVTSTSPASGAQKASASANVSATFSEALDPTTVSGSTFYLTKQGSSTRLSASVTYDAASHTATLNPNSDLTIGTSYTAKVVGGSGGVKDLAGNALLSDKSWTFKVADTTAPTISNVKVVRLTRNRVTIDWTTNESSDSQIEYGLTTSYGSSTSLSTSKVTKHEVQISNLKPQTTYHYRVKSKDAAGNLATSADFTVTTPH
jgi:glucose/arabinose dehydrogenase/endonuclease YncB( thermonuclease family)/methionine-rich copper-binding protein CopC